DALLEVLGEGLIQHSSLVDLYRRLLRKVGPSAEIAELDLAVVSLDKTLKRLEATLMETRLPAVSNVLGRSPGRARDSARGEGKPVRVEMSGGAPPLDKAVPDRLGEPLLHLVTNAVVHGIESPEDRRAAGKPVEGVLRLDAASVSG